MLVTWVRSELEADNHVEAGGDTWLFEPRTIENYLCYSSVSESA